jgi:tRNA threonylcarbamoyladenosine biosynthesis protein TsaB
MVQFPNASSTELAHSALKILALDTSGDCCSAALLIEDQVEQRCEKAPRRHAELILGMMDELLLGANLRLNELDAVAYGRGPGSFTGVRIAAAVAQGVAFGAGRAVIGVSTLAALARAASRQTDRRRIACALDARMGEIYWGCYRIDDNDVAIPLDPELVIAPEQTPVLAGFGWCGAGSGWAAYPELREQHRSALQPGVEPAPAADDQITILDCTPEASDIAWLAQAAKNQARRPDQAVPIYLRNRVTHVKSRRGGLG